MYRVRNSNRQILFDAGTRAAAAAPAAVAAAPAKMIRLTDVAPSRKTEVIEKR